MWFGMKSHSGLSPKYLEADTDDVRRGQTGENGEGSFEQCKYCTASSCWYAFESIPTKIVRPVSSPFVREHRVHFDLTTKYCRCWAGRPAWILPLPIVGVFTHEKQKRYGLFLITCQNCFECGTACWMQGLNSMVHISVSWSHGTVGRGPRRAGARTFALECTVIRHVFVRLINIKTGVDRDYSD